jgi:hypothetical protein
MPDKPDVGFGFGVEGDQTVLSVIRELRQELKNLKDQQENTASSAELLQRAWTGLIHLAETAAIAELAHDVFETGVQLAKLSQITGVSTQTLSVYYKAATDLGVAHETVDRGLGKLARSFVLLEAGNRGAATGFGLLKLQAKDFNGLNTDEKVRKVTDAFAAIKDGPAKAAAAIALFGKSGQELIPVLDALGAGEFAKVQEDAERLGLVFSQEMADGALKAKAALADLKGVAEGVTAQVESGLLPAVADAADGLVAFVTHSNDAGKSGENAFKQIGEWAGWALKAIVLMATAAGTTLKDFFLAVGVALETIGREVINTAKTEALVMWDLANGDFKGAWEAIKAGGIEAANGVKDAWKAVADSLKDSDERFMAGFDKMFANDTPRKLPKAGSGEAGDIRGAELDRSKLDRTEANILKQQAQDEMTLARDLAKQKADQDKRDYDQGLISLEEYFTRRRDAINSKSTEEISALSAEWAKLQDLLTAAEARGGKTPQQQIANQRQIMELKAQIAHVESQAQDAEIKRESELARVDDEHDRAKQEHLQKELEAQKKLADLEGDRAKSAQLAQQLEDLQLRRELEQLGRTKAEIDAFMAQYGAARSVRSGGQAAAQDFSSELADFEQRKAAIEARAAAGPLFGGLSQYQAERQLKDLYAEEIPLLDQKIEKLRQQAELAKAGSDLQKQLTQQADEETRKLEKMRQEMAKLTNQWKTEIQSAAQQSSRIITTGFNGWIQGQESFGRAAKNVWNGIVMTALESIERITAKWIEQHIIMAAVSKAMKWLGIGGDDNSQNEKKAAQATGSIEIDAAQSAATVFAQAIEQIPFPANLAAAPALAAATEAEVMAFQAQASAGAAAGAAGGAGFYAGGYVARSAYFGGGSVSGPSGIDAIPSWLTDGEYVINQRAVRSIGVDTLDAINRGALGGAFLPSIRQPAPYTSHGLRQYAGGAALKTLTPGGGGGSKAIHMHNSISPNVIDSKDFRDHIDEHMDYIADELKGRMRDFRWP